MRKVSFLIAVIGALFVLSSCDKKENPKDNPAGDLPGGTGNIAITTVLSNPDDTGAAYLQLIDDSEELGRQIDNKVAFPIPFGGTYPFAIGNDLFVFPSYTGDSKNELVKYTWENKRLVKSGTLKLTPNAKANSLVKVSDTKAYLGLVGLGTIWIFNPTTMQKTGEIDLTSLGYKDGNPDPGIMIERDGTLFVGLSQMGADFASHTDYIQSDIAVIDTRTDRLLKMISEKTSGFTQPTRPIDPKSIFIDEKGDIYVSCLGDFGMVQGCKAGVLRIKRGETEFDPTYSWTITGASIQNEPKTGGYIASMCYVKGGKGIGYIDIPGYYKDKETAATAISNRAVEIDFYNKTLKKIEGLELSNGYGVLVSRYKEGNLAIGNASATRKGIYRYNLSDGKVSASPMIITTGNPMAFHYFGK